MLFPKVSLMTCLKEILLEILVKYKIKMENEINVLEKLGFFK